MKQHPDGVTWVLERQPMAPKEYKNKLVLVLTKCDTHPVELMSAVLALILGTIWVCSNQAFDHPVYTRMSNVAPQWLWGTAFFLCGGFQFVGLLRTCKIRREATFWASLSWFMLGLFYGNYNLKLPGLWIFAVLALSQFWAWWRIPTAKVVVVDDVL